MSLYVPKPKRWMVHLISATPKPFIYRGWHERFARQLKAKASAKWPRRDTMVKVLCACSVVEVHQEYQRMFTRELPLVDCPACLIAWDRHHERTGADLSENLEAHVPFETYGSGTL